MKPHLHVVAFLVTNHDEMVAVTHDKMYFLINGDSLKLTYRGEGFGLVLALKEPHAVEGDAALAFSVLGALLEERSQAFSTVTHIESGGAVQGMMFDGGKVTWASVPVE